MQVPDENAIDKIQQEESIAIASLQQASNKWTMH
jgi:hypothetical protein